MEMTRSSKLPPRCRYQLMILESGDVLRLLGPDNDDHTNTLPLQLCFAILYSFDASQKGLRHDFNSPLVFDFKDALPNFLDKIYDLIPRMFSRFDKDPSWGELSFPRTPRVFLVAIEFLLHRLSPPEPEYRTIHLSLTAAVGWIRDQMLLSQEATAVTAVLEDILAPYVAPPLNVVSDWMRLFNDTILVYHSLISIAPSASLLGLRSMVDFMTIHLDHWHRPHFYCHPDVAFTMLTNLLAKRMPVAFNLFLENQYLQFLGNCMFREALVPMVSEYVAGIFTMQHGSDGAMDAAALRVHLDYLHNPHNLFTACSILATHGVEDKDRASIFRDIMTLV
ncbi:hypothetical protein ARMSODRAFT_1013029 [Armillaria solidipes]|uniref:Uncharacterized protein n=1 Tax=Armillaria solidipes TaxID=1076256 RepID=A0A2H3CB70_9AGAR|nr:hypothetical protein ARMSODRAFT_1013029 [Armillaria solidipes]